MDIMFANDSGFSLAKQEFSMSSVNEKCWGPPQYKDAVSPVKGFPL